MHAEAKKAENLGLKMSRGEFSNLSLTGTSNFRNISRAIANVNAMVNVFAVVRHNPYFLQLAVAFTATVRTHCCCRRHEFGPQGLPIAVAGRAVDSLRL
jgi:hypothetical protein